MFEGWGEEIPPAPGYDAQGISERAEHLINIIEGTCNRKKRFSCVSEAQGYLNSLKRSRGEDDDHHIYKCRYCAGGYHIGSEGRYREGVERYGREY